jgi:hypothetical protein
MNYSLAGVALALLVSTAAWRQSRCAGGFYDREVYGMTAATHRRYAVASLLCAAFFATTYALRLNGAGIAALGPYALLAILYATSFLRGASDE